MLKFKRLEDDAKIPTKGSKYSAGFDLYACQDKIIPAGSWTGINTGIAVEFPETSLECYGRIAPRSGLTIRYGLNVGAGVIDRDYRNSIVVILFNHGKVDYQVKKGDRIAQLIPELYLQNAYAVEAEILSETDRGLSGLGSTGK